MTQSTQLTDISFSENFNNELKQCKRQVDEFTEQNSFTHRFKFFSNKFEQAFNLRQNIFDYHGICKMFISCPLHIDVKEEIDKLLIEKGFNENKNLDNMLDYYFETDKNCQDITIFYLRKYKKCDVSII
jgi:hypothetical protein